MQQGNVACIKLLFKEEYFELSLYIMMKEGIDDSFLIVLSLPSMVLVVRSQKLSLKDC